MKGLFNMGSILFGILVFVLIIISSTFVEKEKSTASSLIGSLFFLGLVFSFSEYMYGYVSIAMAYVISNPLVFVGFVLLYFVVGGLYVLLWRYGRFIRDDEEEINYAFNEKKKRDADYTVEEFLTSDGYVYRYGPMSNKYRIFNWIMLWPLSLIGNVSYRPVVAITKFVYENITNSLKNVSKRVGRKVINNK